jgi:CHASE3 domain sensor protein
MKYRLNYLIASFFLSITILLLISFLFYRKLQNLSDWDSRAEHSYRIIYNLDRVDSHLKKAESSQRGFLLTGDKAFLKTYYRASDSVMFYLNIIKDSTSDNPDQQKNLSFLQGWVSVRLNYMNKNLFLKRSDTVLLKKELLLGENSMNNYNSVLKDITNEEWSLLEKRNSAKRFYETLSPQYLGLLLIFSTAIFVLSFVFIGKELRKNSGYRHELERRLQELTRMNTALQDFSFVASHNMQEPLRKILTFSNMLLLRYKEELNTETKMILKRIDISCTKMYDLINDFMKFSTLFETTEKIIPVNLNDIIEAIKVELPEKFPGKKINIQSEKLRTVHGFHDQLVILFNCLIDNSIRFSANQIVSEIKITEAQVAWKDMPVASKDILKTSYYKVTFTDNGIGFDNVFSKKIFKLFQQLDVENKDSNAKGIGLAMAEQIMFNHHGIIGAEGNPGLSASFFLYFPMESEN